jgi:hypothetical protein
LLRWLAMDGYGFHQGFFHWPRFVDQQEQPKRLSAYARCVFDNGLGRSLWFVKGANPERIAAAIAAFAPERRPHLWAGIGLAAAFAGGVERSALETLRELSGDCLPQLAQGVTFAAATRERAGNIAGHTELACEIVWRLTAEQAADIPLKALDGLANEGGLPAYEVWRRRIHAQFRESHS